MAPPTLIPDSWAYFDGDMDERGELLGRAELRELSGLRAGNEYEFFQPAHPDDVITATWKVGEAVERTGRAGRTIFQEFEARFTNQRGELLAISRETMFHPCNTMLYDDVTEGTELEPLTVDLTAHRMMAYGAATWDFIRVHYDAATPRSRASTPPLSMGRCTARCWLGRCSIGRGPTPS